MTARFTPHGSSFVRTTLAEADSLLHAATIQTIDCNRHEHAWWNMSFKNLFISYFFLTVKQNHFRRDYTPLVPSEWCSGNHLIRT
jgi:hypothetical protein